MIAVLSLSEAFPNRGYYNHYNAGAAGGGYVHTSGGSYGYNNRYGVGRPYYRRPRGGYSSGGFQAKGGFVAGGGSVSGGYNRGNHIKNKQF